MGKTTYPFLLFWEETETQFIGHGGTLSEGEWMESLADEAGVSVEAVPGIPQKLGQTEAPVIVPQIK